ncbi:MAG: hypothetical protein NZ914_15245, partial [Gemmatales bacterium]|nr:hypothetical protein [Gemmatales bacterium]
AKVTARVVWSVRFPTIRTEPQHSRRPFWAAWFGTVGLSVNTAVWLVLMSSLLHNVSPAFVVCRSNCWTCRATKDIRR